MAPPSALPPPLGCSPRRRRLAFRIVAPPLALLVALAIGEVAVRVIAPQRTMFTGRGLFAPDPAVGHVLRPNVVSGGVRTNSLGFRDREYPLRKPPGAFRIVAIGDSFTFGAVSIEDVYTEILEDLFAKAGPPYPVEVINEGVPCYNTDQELRHFLKLGLRLAPDFVVLGFFVGNDVSENRETKFYDVVDGELANRHRKPSKLSRWLARSHLYRLLSGYWNSPLNACSAGGDLRTRFLATEGGRIDVCRVPASRGIETGFRRSEELLVALRDILREKHIGLVVLLIPDEFQVEPDLFDEVTKRFERDPREYDLDLPQRRLGEFLSRESIPFVDVLAACRERNGTGERVYLENDTHWNRAGNEIAARALLEALRPCLPPQPR